MFPDPDPDKKKPDVAQNDSSDPFGAESLTGDDLDGPLRNVFEISGATESRYTLGNDEERSGTLENERFYISFTIQRNSRLLNNERMPLSDAFSLSALKNQYFFFMADGVGSSKYGSTTASECVIKARNAAGRGGNISQIEKSVWSYIDSEPDPVERNEMSTTFTGVEVQDSGEVKIFYRGDSPVWRLTESGLKRLTKDHTALEELIRTLEDIEDGREISCAEVLELKPSDHLFFRTQVNACKPDRLTDVDKHRILHDWLKEPVDYLHADHQAARQERKRGFVKGARILKSVNGDPGSERTFTHVDGGTLRIGDKLLMTTDGIDPSPVTRGPQGSGLIWGLSDQEIEAIIRNADSDLEAVKELTRIARAMGSRDDIVILLMTYRGAPESDASDGRWKEQDTNN